MTRRDLVQFLGFSALAAALPGLAAASDSGNSSGGGGASAGGGGGASSAGSGDSSGDSANSSGQSADSSGESANSSQRSGDSSDSGNSSGPTGFGNEEFSASAAVVALSLTTTIGVVVLVLLIAGSTGRRTRRGKPPPPRTPSALLLDSGFLNARRDLGLQLSQLAMSPAALDRLAAEAGAGEGPALQSLARAAGLPPPRVADAVTSCWYPATTTWHASRISLQILVDLAPELAPDPDFVAESLASLRREQQRGDPTHQPVHQQLAQWMGVAAHDYAPVVSRVLADLPGRAALHADPQPAADALADALNAAFPNAVAERIQAMRAKVQRMNRDLALGLLQEGA